MTDTAYTQLEAIFARAAHLRAGERTLSWDRRTQMPAGGAASRAKVLATVRTVANETLAHPRVRDLLDAAEAAPVQLDLWQVANLREMRRLWRQTTAVPPALQTAIAELEGPAESTWQRARRDNDYRSFVEPLRALLSLNIEAAGIHGELLGVAPYDALLDGHEPGLRMATIDPLFDDLAGFLRDLGGKIAERQRGHAPIPFTGPLSEPQQVAMSRCLAGLVGYDFDQGRLDISAHPQTSPVPGDIRITTRFNPDDPRDGIIATIHETGHAMYEAGLPHDWLFQPVALARGGAIHESQALIFEMQASRSAPFLAYLAKLLRETFAGHGAGHGPAWTDDNVLRLYRHVEPGFIRIEADEVTYPLHINLRYRIERQLVDGSLDVADVPEAWNAISKELLGVVPPTDTVGCLQDPHWTMGYLGYFPVYSMGAMIAAQMFAAARQAEPELVVALGRGDFGPLLGWTHRHVHRRGSLPASGEELILQATGERLSTKALKEHLVARYLDE